MATGTISNVLKDTCYLKGTYSLSNCPVMGRVGVGSSSSIQRITMYFLVPKSLSVVSSATASTLTNVTLFGSNSGYNSLGNLTSDIDSVNIRGGTIMVQVEKSGSFGMTQNEIFMGSASITFTVS